MKKFCDFSSYLCRISMACNLPWNYMNSCHLAENKIITSGHKIVLESGMCVAYCSKLLYPGQRIVKVEEEWGKETGGEGTRKVSNRTLFMSGN